MKKITLLRKLKYIKIKYCEDDEMAHIEADEALLKYIDDEKIKRAFKDIPKWYS